MREEIFTARQTMAEGPISVQTRVPADAGRFLRSHRAVRRRCSTRLKAPRKTALFQQPIRFWILREIFTEPRRAAAAAPSATTMVAVSCLSLRQAAWRQCFTFLVVGTAMARRLSPAYTRTVRETCTGR